MTLSECAFSSVFLAYGVFVASSAIIHRNRQAPRSYCFYALKILRVLSLLFAKRFHQQDPYSWTCKKYFSFSNHYSLFFVIIIIFITSLISNLILNVFQILSELSRSTPAASDSNNYSIQLDWAQSDFLALSLSSFGTSCLNPSVSSTICRLWRTNE